MAESFYAGTKYIGWEGICIGDPLCCPFAGRKLVKPTLAAGFSDSHGGVQTEDCSEGYLDVGLISNGSYTAYNNVNLSAMKQFKARVASAGSGGNIQIRLDSPQGKLIGTCFVPVTGDWQTWTSATCSLSPTVTGKHTLYLVYGGENGFLFNIEWFALS